MKILLINPIIGEKQYIKFPLGLAYIASILLKENHEVKVLDINAYRYSKEKVESILKGIDFDVAGITGLLTEYSYIKWIGNKIKDIKPDVKIILGGGLGTLAPELAISKCNIDVAVMGEGESVVKELINALEAGTSLKKVRGIAFRGKNKRTGKEEIIRTVSSEIIKDMDSIPFPSWRLFPMEAYIRPSYLRLFNKNIRTIEIITSRGCPYNCTYCFKGQWGQKYRNRSANNILQEIKLLMERYGINGIQFNDDTFVLNRRMVVELCDAIAKEKLDIIWMANGRVNLMDRELLGKMRKAGCRAISYGIESGSQKILNDMKKGVTVAQIKKAVKETWKAGILPHGYLMIGMPNDTKDTVEETIKLCQELSLVGQFSVVTPIPGSELWEQAKKMGRIGRDIEYYLERWSKWNKGILINLTNMGDDELLKLKKKAESRIFFGNMPIKILRHCRIIDMKNIFRECLIRVKQIFT